MINKKNNLNIMNTTKLWYNDVPFNVEHTTISNFYHYWNPNPWEVYGPGINNPPQTITTTTIFNSEILNPDVYITKNKSRLKVYGNTVHLNDGDEFEIEMFNSTQFTLGVKFKLQGEYISEQHLILQPGMHLFLDRYLNDKRKFKYSTYEVEAKNSKVDMAILNNGFIEIEFYKQVPINHDVQTNVLRSINSNSNITYTGNPDIIGDNILPGMDGLKGIIGNNTSINAYYSTTSLDSNTWTDGLPGMDGNSEGPTLDGLEDEVEMKETGRVDKGSKSNQEFNEVDMDFEKNTYFTATMKIKPMSQKPIEAKDLKPKCTCCNRKCKKNDKFCSSCGTQL